MSLEDAIAETQRVLGPLFSKPSLTEKYLSRPPFRFLHDIVTSTLRETGFPSNFFAAEELDPSNFEDKGKKVAFLEKIITLVNICHGHAIDVRATKIVAGLEPINTNRFLVAFGKASVDSTLDRQLATKYCLDGKTYTEVSVPRLQKNRPLLEQQRNNMETMDKEATRQAETSPRKTKIIVEAEAEVNSDIKTSSLNQQHPADNFTREEWKLHCSGDLLTTREIIEKLIPKPRCTDKLLERPPFSFIYDLLSAISKATSFGTTIFDETTTGACKDKYSKISFLEKVIHHVEHTLSVTIDVKPGQIVAGLEVEKTRQFLQLFVVAATISKSNGTPLSKEKQNSEDSKVDAIGEGILASQQKLTLIPSKTAEVEDSGLCNAECMGQNATEESKANVQSGPCGSLATSLGELNVNCKTRVDNLRELIYSHPGDIAATKQVMESIVIHPKVSEKLLDRPPFRFLHDVILAITKSTGYGRRLLTEKELDSGITSSKEEKIEFLEKIICHVEKSTSTEIGIRAAKIVSGLECEKTRFFLQLLVLAATSSNAENEDNQNNNEDKTKSYANLSRISIKGGETAIAMANPSEILTDSSQRTFKEHECDLKSDEEKKSLMSENVDTSLKDKHQQKDSILALNSPKLLALEEFEGEQRKRIQKPPVFADSLAQKQELRLSGNMQIFSSRPGPPLTEYRPTQPDVSQSDSYMTTQKIKIFQDEVESKVEEWKSFDSKCLDLEHSVLVQDNRIKQLISLTELSSSDERNETVNHRLDLEISSGPPSSEALPLPLSINHTQNNVKNLLEAMQSINRSIGPLRRFLVNYEENLRQMIDEREFWVSEYLAHKENLDVSKKASEDSITDALNAADLEIKNLARNIAETKVTVKRNQSRIRELIDSFSAR
jgi:TRAF3-interacting protein 1